MDSVQELCEVQNSIDDALNSQSNLLDTLNGCNYPTLDGNIPKNNLSKPVTKGYGSTSDILSNMKCFFLEYCFYFYVFYYDSTNIPNK